MSAITRDLGDPSPLPVYPNSSQTSQFGVSFRGFDTHVAPPPSAVFPIPAITRDLGAPPSLFIPIHPSHPRLA
jgi:hypothetical protein